MLYMIGIGLSDEKDITVKGLEAVKSCEHIYLENYTNSLSVPVEKAAFCLKPELFSRQMLRPFFKHEKKKSED